MADPVALLDRYQEAGRARGLFAFDEKVRKAIKRHGAPEVKVRVIAGREG